MFSGRASLGPTGRRTYSTRETQALSDRELVLKKVGQKVGHEKEYKEREKHRCLPKFDPSCCPPYFFVWVDAHAYSPGLVDAVVRTKAINAKMDQPQRRVVVTRTLHRTFGRPQWQQLHDQLQVNSDKLNFPGLKQCVLTYVNSSNYSNLY